MPDLMTSPGTTRDSMTTPPLTGYMSVAGAVDELGRRGFTEGLRVINGGLRATGTGEPIRTEDLVIREVYRFEGVSDPDDMAIVYGIEGRRGLKATVIDAFGVYSDPALSALMEKVTIGEAA
jgi:hypothetical protein